MVRRNYAHGGPVEEHSSIPQIKQDTINRMKSPAVPTAGAVTATGTVAQADQNILSTAGQVDAIDPVGAVTKGTAAQATAFDPRNEFTILDDPRIGARSTGDPRFPAMYSQPPMGLGITKGIAKVDPTKTAETIEGALGKTDAQTGTVGDASVIDAAQQTESSVSGIDALASKHYRRSDSSHRSLTPFARFSCAYIPCSIACANRVSSLCGRLHHSFARHTCIRKPEPFSCVTYMQSLHCATYVTWWYIVLGIFTLVYVLTFVVVLS
jgi:hypothetical protein